MSIRWIWKVSSADEAEFGNLADVNELKQHVNCSSRHNTKKTLN